MRTCTGGVKTAHYYCVYALMRNYCTRRALVNLITRPMSPRPPLLFRFFILIFSLWTYPLHRCQVSPHYNKYTLLSHRSFNIPAYWTSHIVHTARRRHRRPAQLSVAVYCWRRKKNNPVKRVLLYTNASDIEFCELPFYLM